MRFVRSIARELQKREEDAEERATRVQCSMNIIFVFPIRLVSVNLEVISVYSPRSARLKLD